MLDLVKTYLLLETSCMAGADFRCMVDVVVHQT